MAGNWNNEFNRWSHFVHVPVTYAWVSLDPTDRLVRFLDAPGVSSSFIYHASAMPLNPGLRYGVYGTPTLLLIDKYRRLRHVTIGYVLPPAARVREVCR
jgi:hypothetical protein